MKPMPDFTADDALAVFVALDEATLCTTMPTKTDQNTALVKPASTAVDKFAEGFHGYLSGLGLPTDGVLVAPEQRMRVIHNVPALVEMLAAEQRGEAMYVSKFIAACGAGLFDAALNFIWDEVVVRLRKRVAAFDLAYFFDTAVPPQERQDYQTEEDLASLADAALIRGALNCGMLTEIGYKHLDYIRDMRNWASAAHPNQASLTGLQLVGWFETCLKEVILREPAGAVLEVGRLLRNLRDQTISAKDAPAIAASIKKLPHDLVAPLLRNTSGLFCDPRQDVRIRDNIKHVAEPIWSCASESARGEIGLKYANYAANADVDRKKLAHDFLELVDGLAYLPTSDLALNIQQLVSSLETAHGAMNNFYNEAPVARQLRKFVPPTGKVPDQINEEYVRVLVRCRMGRSSGVANAAVPIYDELIDLFDEPQLKAFIKTLARAEITSRISAHADCYDRFQAIATRLATKVVGTLMKQAFAKIGGATRAQLANLWVDTSFGRIVIAL
jgi:hypothetical protein